MPLTTSAAVAMSRSKSETCFAFFDDLVSLSHVFWFHTCVQDLLATCTYLRHHATIAAPGLIFRNVANIEFLPLATPVKPVLGP